jgi:hypothetical protein
MSCSTSTRVVPIGSRRIVIEGLEKLQDTSQVNPKETLAENVNSSPFSIIMHDDEPMSELWNRIEGFQSIFRIIGYFIDVKQTAVFKSLSS